MLRECTDGESGPNSGCQILLPSRSRLCVLRISFSTAVMPRCSQDTTYLSEVLAKGADTASEVSTRTVGNVRQAMGFMPR